MFMRLLLIFIIVPLIEIYLLIEIGSRIGASNTILIVIITGVLGAYMMRQEGFYILRNIQNDLSQGVMPTGELISGMLVLIGGIVLLTPGFLTDTIGFIFLIPASRNFIRDKIRLIIKKKINS